MSSALGTVLAPLGCQQGGCRVRRGHVPDSALSGVGVRQLPAWDMVLASMNAGGGRHEERGGDMMFARTLIEEPKCVYSPATAVKTKS